MQAAGLLERLRARLTSRRVLLALTILFGLVVVLYFLFATFLFNPFEESLPDTAAIVPQEASYFLRWRGAGQFFDPFPVPQIWSDLAGTGVYRTLKSSGELDRMGRELGVAELVAELQRATAALPAGLDLEDDLLREVVLAGRGTPRLDSTFDGVLMLRVSFKVKAGVALLGFAFVRDRLPRTLALEALGGGRFRLPQFRPFGYQDAYLARFRDVLLLASREEWLERARELEIRRGEGSLGQASRFHDNVTALLAPGDRPLEVFLRWEGAGAALGRWPDPGAPDLWTRLAGRLFDSDALRYVAGYWLPQQRFKAQLGGELDLAKASDFQKVWYSGAPLPASRIRSFAEMVPGDSFWYAAFAGDVGRLLLEAQGALEEDVRRLLEEAIVNAGAYSSLAHLLSDVSEAVAPGLFVALRRNDYAEDPQRATPHDEAPVPLFVLMANLRNEAAYERVLDFFKGSAARLGEGADRPRLEAVTVVGGARATAFASRAIPGTGEVLVMTLPARRAVLVSNSHLYLEQVLKTALMGREPELGMPPSLAASPPFQAVVAELQGGAHAFQYADPGAARHWLERVGEGLARAEFQREREAAWRAGERALEERRQRDLLFPRWPGDLTPEQEDQIREAVDQALAARMEELRRVRVPELRAEIERRFLPLQLVDWVAVGLRAGRKDAALLVSGELALE